VEFWCVSENGECHGMPPIQASLKDDMRPCSITFQASGLWGYSGCATLPQNDGSISMKISAHGKILYVDVDFECDTCIYIYRYRYWLIFPHP
jgi:hypothetical protein